MTSTVHQTSEITTLTQEQQDKVLKSLQLTDSCYTREDSSINLPRLHVTNSYYFNIYGVDAIWQNIYSGPNSDWSIMRKQYDASIDQLVVMVGEHVKQGLYSIVSLNASKHNLTVVCACEKTVEETGGRLFDDPGAAEAL